MKINILLILLSILVMLTLILNIEIVTYNIADEAFESIQGHSLKVIHMTGQVIEFPLNINYIDVKLHLDGETYLAESYHINEVLSNSLIKAYSISFKDKIVDQKMYSVSALVTENSERTINNIQVMIKEKNLMNQSISINAYYQQFN